MPDADWNKWIKPDALALTIKGWAEGVNRPANNSFLEVDAAEGGTLRISTVTFPK